MGCLCCCQAKPNEPRNPTTSLYFDIASSQWPVVYSSQYNISFCGFENLHPFDSKKWGRVYDILEREGMVQRETVVEPMSATDNDLLVVHTRRYLNSLNWSANVAMITEVPPVACLCNCLVQRAVLDPLRCQTGGSVLAAKLAIERGWAVNIGGGFHHCSGDQGGGFCVYADITLAIKFLFQRVASVKRAMIIDLDAHQGNGHERDFLHDPNVYIMDVYNAYIYPNDVAAKRGISRSVELQSYTRDEEYLKRINSSIEASLNEFDTDVVIYNAGTDILAGDPLGRLSISAEGIVQRDELVFRHVRSRHIPIVMLTSGGYQRQTAEIIANSLLNLRNKGLISCQPLSLSAVKVDGQKT